jgi:hypothetical protein
MIALKAAAFRVLGVIFWAAKKCSINLRKEGSK